MLQLRHDQNCDLFLFELCVKNFSKKDINKISFTDATSPHFREVCRDNFEKSYCEIRLYVVSFETAKEIFGILNLKGWMKNS